MLSDSSISGYFVKSINEKPDIGLKEILVNICKQHGFLNATYFCTGIPRKEIGAYVLITTYPPSWIKHYFDNNYRYIDPIIKLASQSIVPVDWGSISLESREIKQFFGEASEFGLGRHGLTIPVRGLHNDVALFSVILDAGETEGAKRKFEILSDLTYVAHLIHHQVIKSRCNAVYYNARCKLSPREKEVLQWAADGKTAWETAKIINLSEKTVSSYISNACNKLQATTKTQAIAKVLSDGSLSL